MLVAQLSDFHVVEAGELAYGRVDTGAMLARAIGALNISRPRPSLAIGSGDLVQHGTDEEYDELRRILAALEVPFAPVVGNHDRRAAFARAFANCGWAFEPDGYIQYTLPLGELRLVVIDTATEGSDEPSFCEARADWLDGALAASSRPTIVAMHHPPFASGVAWLDSKDPHWAARLARALQHAPQVVRLVAGHVHRAIHASWSGVPASTAPSTAHQVFLDLEGGEPLLSHEAPGFQLHRWTGSELVTYTVSAAGFGEVFSPGPVGVGPR